MPAFPTHRKSQRREERTPEDTPPDETSGDV